jgi:hypothetical protein
MNKQVLFFEKLQLIQIKFLFFIHRPIFEIYILLEKMVKKMVILRLKLSNYFILLFKQPIKTQ